MFIVDHDDPEFGDPKSEPNVKQIRFLATNDGTESVSSLTKRITDDEKLLGAVYYSDEKHRATEAIILEPKIWILYDTIIEILAKKRLLQDAVRKAQARNGGIEWHPNYERLILKRFYKTDPEDWFDLLGDPLE